ncbi:MAG: sterol desaturase family protein [Rhizobiaceae bacterium]|jgi:sterol desaturase/sphingolipid hydroxylase (fatty acid hydroxylase superfamily)|nr:sterol desaturase family protein [Rhizobiaceae bacterium]
MDGGVEVLGWSEGTVRLAVFLAIFTALAALELLAPQLERAELAGALKSKRWVTNVGMLLLSSLVLRVLFPAAAVGVALWAEQAGFGLFHWLEIPVLVAGLLAFVALDFAVWLEHVVSHKWRWLWRIHRVHHADNGFDLTTALRFHPLEILISMVWKGAVVALLGAPVLAVLIFEIVLNGMAMFNHANLRLPRGLDGMLRFAVVTPDMHRIHHSQIMRETDSNYGFNLAIWDRLFGTYTAEPVKGRDGLDIGLSEFKADQSSRLDWSLMLPFRK